LQNKYPMKNQFDYAIKYYSRSRHLRISIHEDGKVLVTAPKWASKKAINEFVLEHTYWIEEQLKVFKNKKTLDKLGQRALPGLHAVRARTKKLVLERLRLYNKHYKLHFNRVVIRNQRSRWGSCSAQKHLNFNYKLFFLPPELLDYVVVHELCHLQELNHSHKFWALVGETIPNYQERKKQLRGVRLG